MTRSRMLVAAVAAAGLAGATLLWAQTRDYTPSFLRAAISSIRDRTPVTVTGEYMSTRSLVEARGTYLRGKGYSRFFVRDTENGAIFESMYCEQDSKAFSDLLAAQGRKVYTFSGHKERGEMREDAVIVTRVEWLRDITEPPAATAASPLLVAPAGAGGAPKPLRVTITNHSTSNRTVVANVVRGQAYTVDNLTVIVEDEPER